MTFQEYFDGFKARFDGVDVSEIHEHLAFEFNIEDAEAGGAFYVEVKEGQLYIEPYQYYDRDAAFTCTPEVLDKIVTGKTDPIAAFTMQKLKVDGSIEKALRLKDIVDSKRKKAGRGKKK